MKKAGRLAHPTLVRSCLLALVIQVSKPFELHLDRRLRKWGNVFDLSIGSFLRATAVDGRFDWQRPRVTS